MANQTDVRLQSDASKIVNEETHMSRNRGESLSSTDLYGYETDESDG